VMDEIKAGIQYAFQTQNRLTLAISGSGTSATEARAADIAGRLGANVHELLKPPGEYFAPWDIEEGLAQHKPSVLFITHGESSTGVLPTLVGVALSSHRHGCLLLVDAVASLGGAPIFMDHQGKSHKLVRSRSGASPALCFAREKMLRRKKKPPSFYLDMGWLANYWGCDGEPRRCQDLLPPFCPQGLESSWERHRANCTQLCQGLRDLGLELFVKEEKARLPTITTVRIPEGYDWKEITAFLMDNHSIEIAGGLGPSVGKVLRIGLMGCNSTSGNVDRNSTSGNVDRVLHALQDALGCCRRSRL
ncbi:PREDICTED: LOW QUALITY PROTEIN: serine--pyruvate aminotransferase, partial [Fulmarus glacialis]|uniref:LOW QUALITY PROTEIN: serine--pyruvate aminotransferase n=1 Tax=Fulmarus glacialis TaxID=30455 RepID=UPI00051BF032